jgi:hypothetical protein
MKTKFPTHNFIVLIINIIIICLYSFWTISYISKGQAFFAALCAIFVFAFINLSKDKINTLRLYFILNKILKLSEDNKTKYLDENPKIKKFMDKMSKNLK